MKFLIMQFSPNSCHFRSVWSKYSLPNFHHLKKMISIGHQVLLSASRICQSTVTLIVFPSEDVHVNV
jgi:hypothetical protein